MSIVKPKILKSLYFTFMADAFKNNLRAELDFLDLTVKELSAKTGISKRTLDCYLGGRVSMPPADIAVKIASALGVSVEYLVTGKDGTGKKEAALPLFDCNIRSILQIILTLDEKDVKTVLGLAAVLKEQAERGR